MVTQKQKTQSTPPRRNSAGLRRDLTLLQILGSPEAITADGLGVIRIAQLAERDKAVVSRSLSTLAEAGLVDRDPASSRYRLGHQLYALAARTAESRLVHQSAPFLRKVVAATHETTHLCVLRGGNVLTLASELSEYAFRGLGWEGVSTAAWQTSSGRVLISDWSEESLLAWYKQHGKDKSVVSLIEPLSSTPGETAEPEPVSGRPLVSDFPALKEEIARIRRNGYAKVDEEFELGVVGVSAPIFDFRRNIIAAINLSAPKHRVGDRLDDIGRLVAHVASEFSAYLGHRP